MDETEQKVEELAITLKQKFLAATMEEARERARQIILSSQDEKLPSLKDVMGNV